MHTGPASDDVFQACIDSERNGLTRGPIGVSLAEALLWARSRTPVVLVDMPRGRYTAGEQPDPDFPQLVPSSPEPWQPAIASEAEAPPPNWTVTSTFQTADGRPLGHFALVLTETLWSDLRVHNFDDDGTVADELSPQLVATFDVVANSERDAVKLAQLIAAETLDDARDYAKEQPPEVQIEPPIAYRV